VHLPRPLLLPLRSIFVACRPPASHITVAFTVVVVIVIVMRVLRVLEGARALQRREQDD